VPSCGLVIETREPQELPCGRGGSDGEVDLQVPGAPERRKVVINLSNCRYPVLEEAAAALDWAVTRDRHLGLGGARAPAQSVAAHQTLAWYALPSSIHTTMVCPSTRRLSTITRRCVHPCLSVFLI
jgi:hypothetical protein